MKVLQDMDVTNKKVVVRVDYNVAVKDGKILDDSKIKKSLETINYLLDKNCKIILLSHFGKVKKEEDKRKNSLKVVAERLNELVSTNVIFSPTTRSSSLEMKVMDLQPREILMLENTRFEDVPNNFESGNDPQLAAYFASLGDVFVMDAFASAHRSHASTVGITSFIPSCAGFLVQKEIEMLQKYVLNPEHPFTIVMGGAKVEDKLPIMEKLLPKCDYLLLTGGLANSALRSLGLNIGESLCTTSNELLSKVKDILVKYKNKVILPYDAIVSKKYMEDYVDSKSINHIANDEVIGDVGPNTLKKYEEIFNKSKTIFVNGTCGIYEEPKFSNGTLELFRLLSSCGASVILGGGDCVSAATKFNMQDKFTYVSTGGGATLEYIVKESLPAIDAIDK